MYGVQKVETSKKNNRSNEVLTTMTEVSLIGTVNVGVFHNNVSSSRPGDSFRKVVWQSPTESITYFAVTLETVYKEQFRF